MYSTLRLYAAPREWLWQETEKTVRVIDPTKPTDCANDDDCMDYSGLPKSASARHGLKNFRKPYLGLSITTPLPW